MSALLREKNKIYFFAGMLTTVVLTTAVIYFCSLLGFHHPLTALILFFLIGSCLLVYLFFYLFSRRNSMLWAMKQAIKKKEFYPNYQPIYDQKTNTYIGIEVLLRWQNSENEIIMPNLFIIDAEIHGIIVPITLQMIEIVFKETLLLLDEFPNFHIAINISASHFMDSSFFDKFRFLMKKYAVSPHQIIFEITERELLDKNNDIFYLIMNQLRTEGFSLAVDDYGTGHASISYLNNFPFNYLKVDKLFIQSIGTKAITESLNDAIINMAKQLNLTIIAEGVETEEQYNYLVEHQVNYMQGWYFSKALSINQLITLLRNKDESKD